MALSSVYRESIQYIRVTYTIYKISDNDGEEEEEEEDRTISVLFSVFFRCRLCFFYMLIIYI